MHNQKYSESTVNKYPKYQKRTIICRTLKTLCRTRRAILLIYSDSQRSKPWGNQKPSVALEGIIPYRVIPFWLNSTFSGDLHDLK